MSGDLDASKVLSLEVLYVILNLAWIFGFQFDMDWFPSSLMFKCMLMMLLSVSMFFFT